MPYLTSPRKWQSYRISPGVGTGSTEHRRPSTRGTIKPNPSLCRWLQILFQKAKDVLWLAPRRTKRNCCSVPVSSSPEQWLTATTSPPWSGSDSTNSSWITLPEFPRRYVTATPPCSGSSRSTELFDYTSQNPHEELLTSLPS